MNLQILYPISIGLVGGLFFSIFLGVYNKHTSSALTNELFGVNSPTLLMYLTLGIMSFFLVVASTFAILIRDLKFPQEHPIPFTLETLFISFVCALMIFAMHFFRRQKITSTVFMEYILLAVKFGIAHILFQFSGVYTTVFGV
jgi:hypothetical protein